MKIKKSVFLLLFAIVLLSFSGCSENSQLHQKLIIQGIGIESIENEYVLTVQALDFKNPSKEDKPSTKILEIRGNSLLNALENISKQTSLTPVYSQNMIIILSESIVKNSGVNNFIDFFIRHFEARPKVKICVVKGRASEYLKIKSEDNKVLTAKDIHDLIPGSLNSDVLHFVSNLKSGLSNSYLSWVDIEDKNGLKQVHLKGVGVLLEDNLIKFIEKDEALAFMVLKSVPNFGTFVVENENLGKIMCLLEKSEVKTNVNLEEGKTPKYRINLNLRISVFSMSDKLEFDSEEEIKNRIGEEFSKKITALCSAVIGNFLDQGIDVFDFGKILKNSYPQYFKKIDGDWKSHLKNCKYEANSKVNVIITGKEPI